MSPVRFPRRRVPVRLALTGLAALAAAVPLAACSSSGDQAAPTTSRPAMVFKPGVPKANDLGVCSAFEVAAVKELIGGGNQFRILAPTAIGKKGEPVVGERCAWERAGGGDQTKGLTIEARRWTSTDDLTTAYGKLREQTVGATDQAGLGDAAFSAVGPTTTLLQVRSGPYFLTFSSLGQGGLDPVPLAELQDLARTALGRIS